MFLSPRLRFSLIAILCLGSIEAVAQTSFSGTVNRYTPVTAIERCGVTVASTSGFSPGDRVVVIQMQGATIEVGPANWGEVLDLQSAGRFEIATIKSVTGSSITFVSALVNEYQVSGRVQLVRLAVADEASVDGQVTATPWDGRSGGIVAIEVSGTLTVNAAINASGAGFRGGDTVEQRRLDPQYCADLAGADSNGLSHKGEGIAGYGLPGESFGRGAPANGGGGGGNHNAGGGGGASAGCGGDGGFSYRNSRYSGVPEMAQGLGGHSVTQLTANRLFLGGGGGAGHTNNRTGSPGGTGGGIILLLAGKIVSNGGSLVADGESAMTSAFDGGGGGGAGGMIAIVSSSITGTVAVSAKGGNGGSTDNTVEQANVGPGGGGGGGAVLGSSAAVLGAIAVDLGGGMAGITVNGIPYGAESGCSGETMGGFRVPEGTDPCTIDTGQVGYTFYFATRCPGVTLVQDVSFNSRRFTDTIVAITFSGPDANRFYYAGPSPVSIPIIPTTDQQIPIGVRYVNSGLQNAVMELTTSRDDRFRIGLRALVKPGTTPVFDVDRVDLGIRSTPFDTCLILENQLGAAVEVSDTAWSAGSLQVQVTLNDMPRIVGPGGQIEVCVSGNGTIPGQSDTVWIGTREAIRFCPKCFFHTLVFTSEEPRAQPSSVANDWLNTAQVGLRPNLLRSESLVVADLEYSSLMGVTLVDASGRVMDPPAVSILDDRRVSVQVPYGLLSPGDYYLVFEMAEGQLVGRMKVLK